MSLSMDATDLGRWTRFAAKGGIGRCTAVQDCVAHGNEDLMFLIDDEIVVLMQLPEEGVYLGYCEGVVGKFQAKDVRIHGKLKKPVIQRRSSTSTASIKSISPIPTQPMPIESLEITSAGRLSLPPPRKAVRVSTSGEDGGLSPATPLLSSFTNRPSFIAASPNRGPHSPDMTPRSKRRGGLINVGSLSIPPNLSPATSEDHDVSTPPFTPSDYPFPQPPSTLPILKTPQWQGSLPAAGSGVRIVEEQSEPPSQVISPPPQLPPPSPVHPLSLKPVNASPRNRASVISATNQDDSGIGVSMSMDGETGIGLALLGGLDSDEGSDSASEYDDDEPSYSAPAPVARNMIPPVHQHPERSPSAGVTPLTTTRTSSPSVHSVHTNQSKTSSPRPPSVHTHRSRTSSPIAHSVQTHRSRTSSPSAQRSTGARSTSTADESMESEWDAGADIYDNYRYSRYSMSMKSSRSSQVPSTTRTAPPLPAEKEKGDERERKDSNHSLGSSGGRGSGKFNLAGRRPSVGTPSSAPPENTSFFFERRPSPANAEVPVPYSPRLSVETAGTTETEGTDETLEFPMPPASTEPLQLVPKASPKANRTPPPPALILHHEMSSEPVSPASTAKHLSAGPSPLLHTGFASPTTSATSSSDFRDSLTTNNDVDISPTMVIRPLPARSVTPASSYTGTRSSVVTVHAPAAAFRKFEAEKKNSADSFVVPDKKDSHDTEEEIIVFDRSTFEHRVEAGDSKDSADLTLAAVDDSMVSNSSTILDDVRKFVRSPSPSRINSPQLELPRASDSPAPPSASPSPIPPFPPSPSALMPQTPPINPSSPIPGASASPFPPHPYAPIPLPSSDPSRHSRGASIHRLAAVSPADLKRISKPPMVASPSLFASLREAAMSYQRPGNAPQNGATIHGKTEKDLATSQGPVAITWTVDGWRERAFDKEEEDKGKTKGKEARDHRITLIGPLPGSRLSPGASVQKSRSTPSPKVIQRPNFSPQAGMRRPRSSSFSGFDAQTAGSAAVKGTGITPRQGSPQPGPSRALGHQGAVLAPSPALVKAPSPKPQTLAPSPLNPSPLGLPQGQHPVLPPLAARQTETSPPLPLPSASGLKGDSPREIQELHSRGMQSQSQGQPPPATRRAPPPLTLPSTSISKGDYSRERQEGIPRQMQSSSQSARSPAVSTFSVDPPRSLSDHPSRSASSSPGPSYRMRAMSPPPINGIPGEPRRVGLRHYASSAGLQTPTRNTFAVQGAMPNPQSRPPPPQPQPQPAAAPQPIRRSSGSTPQPDVRPTQIQQTQGIINAPIRRVSEKKLERQLSVETTKSTELSHYSTPSIQGGSPSSIQQANSPPLSPVTRTPSLRSRISLSRLRSRDAQSSSGRPSRDGPPEFSITSRTPSSSAPATPSGQLDFEEETVQVKDMEFELVKPVIRHNQFRGSEDSSRDAKDSISLHSDVRPELQRHATQSPATSGGGSVVLSQDAARSSVDSFQPVSSKANASDAEAGREAHRTRELKWMSSMSTIPAAQASKTKKLRKLLQDPVPDSVRYLVWAHLLNAKAKRMPNVYTQMGQRPKTQALEVIQQDADRIFSQQSHLRDPKGPVVSVVNAYLLMVPDIKYSTGLTVIAGHLLLQSPEEDAFWTLLSLMESHMRPYYSPTGAQLEADTTLFQKVVESTDPQLARKLFGDLSVRPIDLCSVWFSYLFAGTVPYPHLYRIWDILFYEGPVLLFRIGMAILHLNRRGIFSPTHTSPHTVLPILIRPHPETFPDTETFLNHAMSLKVNDNDLRKQRVKVEATLRQQLQHRLPPPATSNSRSRT